MPSRDVVFDLAGAKNLIAATIGARLESANYERGGWNK